MDRLSTWRSTMYRVVLTQNFNKFIFIVEIMLGRQKRTFVMNEFEFLLRHVALDKHGDLSVKWFLKNFYRNNRVGFRKKKIILR